jgi:hypothetical protein
VSGNFSIALWGNDNINPTNTAYLVSFQDPAGNTVVAALFNIVGGSFNLNSATPLNGVPVPIPGTADNTYLRLDAGNTSSASGFFRLKLQATGSPWFDVKGLGASGGGIIDDTAVIQSAINAAQAVNGIVFFPPGAYKLTSTLTITAGCTLLGAANDLGQGAIFVAAAPAFDYIQVNQGAQGGRIRDLGFTATGTPTAGAGININLTSSMDGSGASPFEVEDCVMNNMFNGVLVRNGNQIVINRLFSAACKNDAVKITGGLAVYLLQCNLLGSTLNGVEVTNIGGLWLTDVQTSQGTHGLTVSGGTQIFAQDCIFDTPSGDVIVISTSQGLIEFTGCWFSGSTAGYGLNISNTTGCRIDGGWIRANFLSGVHIQASAHHVYIRNAAISGNGLGNPGQKGVLVDANTTQFCVQNCDIGADSGDAANKQTTGVLVTTGTSDYYIIDGNLNTDPANQTLVTDNGSGTHKSVTGNVA